MVLLWAGSAGFCVVRIQIRLIDFCPLASHTLWNTTGWKSMGHRKSVLQTTPGCFWRHCSHEGGQLLLDWNKKLYGRFRLLSVLPYMLFKWTSKAGSISAWMLTKSLVLEPCFSVLGMGGGVPQTSPNEQTACCFLLNIVFWFSHQLLYCIARVPSAKLPWNWNGREAVLIVCVAILTVCTKISIVRTICGLNTKFQTIG